MSTKFSSALLLLGTVLTVSGCQYFKGRNVIDVFRDPFSEKGFASQNVTVDPVPLRTPSSIVICRSHQCAPAKLSMSKEYVFNSLLHLFDNNNYQKALICQADAAAHTCLENYITLPMTVGITPTNAYIDSVRIADVVIGKSASRINLLLDYNLTYGGQFPECTPAKSILFAKNVNHILIEDAGYSCKMTSIGQTTVKTVFAIDYVDLDYGYIGGYYSIGLSGPAYGGNSGYMMLRLPQNAYPLAPELQAPKNQSANTKPGVAAYGSSAGDGDGQSESSAAGSGNVQVFPLKK